jgi:hypothetical protein
MCKRDIAAPPFMRCMTPSAPLGAGSIPSHLSQRKLQPGTVPTRDRLSLEVIRPRTRQRFAVTG